MASQMKSLMADGSRYLKAFQLFEERSSMSQLMQDLIRNELPATLASIGNGKSHLNVIGVGSGSGELDLEVISELHLKHPDATMDCEVVEPDFQQLHSYKALVSQTPGLDYIKFNWNNMTANEFEDGWKEKKMTKKADIILVFQMLYYVKDPEATISFFRSLLNKNGKLLISLVSDTSGCKKMWQTYMSQLTYKRINHLVTSGDVKNFLDSKGVSCQRYELQSHADISECFTEGDEKGELLLDFVTTLLHFSKAAPPELKAGIMELLHHRDCSVEVDGKVMFNNNAEVIVIDQLT